MNTSYWKIFSIFILVMITFSINAQVFWTETFGDGCNQGTEIDGYSTDNGVWSIQQTGINGQNPNVWYVSATSSFSGVGNCVESCLTDASVTNMSLHIGKHSEDIGAIYATSGDVKTSVRAESPIIDASDYCAIELDFDYLMLGDEEDVAVLWYYDGETWIELETLNSTDLCADGAYWESYSIKLPESSSFNESIQIAFEWKNGMQGSDDSVSFAVDNISLNVNDEENPVISCPDNISSCDPHVTYDDPEFSDNCNGVVLTQVDETGFTSGSDFPIGITNQEFLVTDASGNTASCSFTVEVVDVLDVANIITTTSSLCDTVSLVVEAEEITSGSGEWKVVSGTGTFNNQFAYITGVNNLSIGENIIIWEVDLPECDNFISTDTLKITVYELPFPASTQAEVNNCGHEVFQLNANTPNVGNGMWYAVDTNPSFVDSTIPNTFVSDLNVGWNELVWQVSNGSCPVSRDTMNLFYKPNARIFNQDTTICVRENELYLIGNEVAEPMTNVWAFSEGNGLFESQTATETMATGLSGGVNEITLSQNHPFCGVSRDTLVVLVELCDEYDPKIPTVFTPNNDGKNDLFIIEDLAVLYPECEVQIVNRWGNIVYESTGYSEPWDGTLRNEGEPLPLGAYFYRIDLNDGSRDVMTGSISIVR